MLQAISEGHAFLLVRMSEGQTEDVFARYVAGNVGAGSIHWRAADALNSTSDSSLKLSSVLEFYFEEVFLAQKHTCMFCPWYDNVCMKVSQKVYPFFQSSRFGCTIEDARSLVLRLDKSRSLSFVASSSTIKTWYNMFDGSGIWHGSICILHLFQAGGT